MTHGPREFAPKAQESSLIPLGIQRRQVEVGTDCGLFGGKRFDFATAISNLADT